MDNKSIPTPESSTADRIKSLVGNHQAKLSQVQENPSQAAILDESTLTLEQIQEALNLQTINEIELPHIGHDNLGTLIRRAIQTDKPNIYLLYSVPEKQPLNGSTKIVYYGDQSGELKRFQKNFSEQ
ncbi:MAG: hypothetical protein WAV41_01525 [Microgenomates group bacterium]